MRIPGWNRRKYSARRSQGRGADLTVGSLTEAHMTLFSGAPAWRRPRDLAMTVLHHRSKKQRSFHRLVNSMSQRHRIAHRGARSFRIAARWLALWPRRKRLGEPPRSPDPGGSQALQTVEASP